MARKTYTVEFKKSALDLVQDLGSYTKAARQLGVNDSLLHGWAKVFNFRLDLNRSKNHINRDDSEEVKRLRKENEELKKVNYILKKAAAFFSQDHLK